MDIAGTLALLGNVIAWAITPVLLKLLSDHVDPWTANGIRYPLSAVCFLPLLLLAARSGKLDPRIWKRALVPAGFSLAGQVLWGMAPYYLSAELIVFLIKSSIAWSIVGAMVLFPIERRLLRSRLFQVGLLLAAGGFVALSYAQGALHEPETGTGVLIMAFCAVFFGLYGVSVRWCLTGAPSLLAFGIVAQYVAGGVIVLMLIFGDYRALGTIGLGAWGLIAGSSLLGIAISHVLFYVAIHRLGPSISTSAHLVGPFVTLALANAVFGSSFRFEEWGAGSAMVAGGALLLLAQRAVVRREPRASGDPVTDGDLGVGPRTAP